MRNQLALILGIVGACHAQQVPSPAGAPQAVARTANDPSGFHVWKTGQLKDYAKRLSPKLDTYKSASETLASEGNRTFIIAHREGNGQSEWHEKVADVMMIQSGKATMIYGGTVVNGKSIQAGEIRGDSIQGGIEVQLEPGDVLHIPAKVAHQMKVAAGTQVTYFVAKVVE